MKRFVVFLFFLVFSGGSLLNGEEPVRYRALPLNVYIEKMKAGWVGQIAGVSWGAPTEFKWCDKIIPEEDMPKWRPEMINDAFGQDDLYVEMTFLRSLEEYGLDVSICQAGIDFANSEYPLWCANEAGRKNLRRGIAPPDSSHPKFSTRGNDIDYQIEADFSGLIAPGMPNAAIRFGEKFGRLMNFGDGVYGGQFVGGMYCEAFFEEDIVKIIEAGLACVPAESQYAEMVRDILKWYTENPDDWRNTWKLCQEKYRENPKYQVDSNGGIDVKINGAYILIGLLYGKGDSDETIIISTRCGQDSDCNPSNAAGVLFTMFGYSKLPKRFTEKLDEKPFFSHTSYNFPGLIEVCEKLAKEALIAEGGRIEKNESGEEILMIPVRKTVPSEYRPTWEPGPIAGSRFTDEEMAEIRFHEIAYENMQEALDKLFPGGWTIEDCGPDMNPGILSEYLNRKNVLLTHPLKREIPCVLKRTIEVSKDGPQKLFLSVSHHPQGDWDLIVKVDGKEFKRFTIGPKSELMEGWFETEIDLSEFSGKKIELELLNQPTEWQFEAAYWSIIELR